MAAAIAINAKKNPNTLPERRRGPPATAARLGTSLCPGAVPAIEEEPEEAVLMVVGPVEVGRAVGPIDDPNDDPIDELVGLD